MLIVGDSLSSAYGIDPAVGWVTLLSKRLEEQHFHYAIINISMGGDTTSQGVEKLPAALKEYQPEIVIIALGANDGLRGLPASLIEKNLNTLITFSQTYHAKILLVGLLIPINYGPVYRSQFEQVYKTLTKKYHLIEVPFLLKDVALDPQLMQTDGLHPNTAGQPIILENLWPYLEKLLTR